MADCKGSDNSLFHQKLFELADTVDAIGGWKWGNGDPEHLSYDCRKVIEGIDQIGGSLQNHQVGRTLTIYCLTILIKLRKEIESIHIEIDYFTGSVMCDSDGIYWDMFVGEKAHRLDGYKQTLEDLFETRIPRIKSYHPILLEYASRFEAESIMKSQKKDNTPFDKKNKTVQSKKDRILNTINDIREFRFYGPSDDPDEKTAVCVGYHYLVTQLQRTASPFLPQSISEHLNNISVPFDDLMGVYEARADVDAYLDDVELVIRSMDVNEFERSDEDALSHRNNKPAFSDMAKELWDLRQSISMLASDPFRYPDEDGYSREVLERVAGTKELTKGLFSKHKDPLIKEILIVLSKLHKRLERIHGNLSFIASPPCPDNIVLTKEATEFIENIERKTEATVKDLEKELPALKEEYYNILEDLAARTEVFFNTKDENKHAISSDGATRQLAPIQVNADRDIGSDDNDDIVTNKNKKEYHKYLIEIANKVYRLVSEKRVLEYFQDQINVFCQKNEAFENEYMQLEKTAEKNPELYDYESWTTKVDPATGKKERTPPLTYKMKNPPAGYEGYVWYNGFWGEPTKTPNLMEFLVNPLCRDIPLVVYWNQDNATKVNEDDKLLCSYALLVSIHDVFTECPIYTKNTYKGNWSGHNSWIQSLRMEYSSENNFDMVKSFFPLNEFKARIARAFDDVKADLAKMKPKENGTASVTKEQTETTGSGGKPRTNNLKPIYERAYQSFKLAETKNDSNITDENAYKWLKENPQEDYNLPADKTWERYVREGRKFYGDNKNQPRAGRALRGGNATDDPDILKQVSNQFNKSD